MLTFESQIERINTALSKHSHTWTLKARMDMDYDDVSQIIRLHIYKKWHLWDQEKNLDPWLHRIIRNQIINILRNVYLNRARPCLKCPANLGDDLCKVYVKQCSECPLYKKWEGSKKQSYNIQYPVPLENHAQEVNNQPSFEINYPKAIKMLGIRLKETLNPIEWKIYDLCYIQNKSDKEVAEILNFKYEETRNRYKRICQLQEIVRNKAQQLLRTYGVE